MKTPDIQLKVKGKMIKESENIGSMQVELDGSGSLRKVRFILK